MKINKPKYWDKKKIGLLPILFFPLTLITLLIIFLKKVFCTAKSFNIPVICVGNIYIGGTGKTPTSIFLANKLSELGFKPAIIRKFYSSHVDEHGLIKQNFNNLILKKNRELGIKEAVKGGHDLAILDDGLQDYKVKKNVKIVCFHQNQLVGNGLVLPSGPLRETLSALKNVDIILINGNKVPSFEEKLLKINNKLEIYYSYYKPTNISQFENHDLLAMAGIANPENFFKLLEQHNLKVREKLIFPDHYRFTKNEIQNIIYESERKKLKIIMTEKDYFKINKFNLKKINFLKINIEIIDSVNLVHKIKKKI